MPHYQNVTHFDRFQSILGELIDQHSKINGFVISNKFEEMTQFADSCASQIHRRIKFLPAGNSNVIAAIVVDEHNLITAMRRLVVGYTGLAQALKDEAVTATEAQIEFRKNRKQLEKMRLALSGATMQMHQDNIAESNLIDLPEEINDERTPEELRRSEQLALRAASSLDDKGLREMHKLANSTPRQVLASKGIKLNTFKDLEAYLDMFKKAEQDIAEAQATIRMSENMLKIGIKPKIPVMETSPSLNQRGGKQVSDVPIKISQQYQEGKTFSARHEQRHAQRGREKIRVEEDGDEAGETKGNIAVLKDARHELNSLPKTKLKDEDWKPCRLPIWVRFDSGFVKPATWASANIKADSYQLGWLLHDQFILALPVSLLRKSAREQEDRVARIIKAVSSRSADNMVNMTQDAKGEIKPFTTGGEPGFCYLWLLEKNKLSSLGGHFNIHLIGFPSTKSDFLQAVERSSLGRQRDTHKSTMQHNTDFTRQMDHLKSIRNEADQTIENQSNDDTHQLGKLRQQREQVEHQFGLFNNPEHHTQLGQEIQKLKPGESIVNFEAIKGIKEKIEKLNALISEFSGFEEQETPLKQAVNHVKAIKARIDEINLVLANTANANRRNELMLQRDRLITGELSQAEALVEKIKAVVDTFRAKLREIKQQEEELKTAARAMVLEQRKQRPN